MSGQADTLPPVATADPTHGRSSHQQRFTGLRQVLGFARVKLPLLRSFAAAPQGGFSSWRRPERAQDAYPLLDTALLLDDVELDASIVGATIAGAVGIDRRRFTEALREEAVWVDTGLEQVAPYRCGAAI